MPKMINLELATQVSSVEDESGYIWVYRECWVNTAFIIHMEPIDPEEYAFGTWVTVQSGNHVTMKRSSLHIAGLITACNGA